MTQEPFPLNEPWFVRIETTQGRLTLDYNKYKGKRNFAFLKEQTLEVFPHLETKNWVFRAGLTQGIREPVSDALPLVANDSDLAKAFQQQVDLRLQQHERTLLLGFNFILLVHVSDE